MNSIFFSADPKQANMGDAISHFETHQKLYFEVKFPIRKASFQSFPIAGFIHISGTGHKVQYVARIEDIVPFSKDHYEKPKLYGDVRPSKWLTEWRQNVNDIQSEPWKHALVITEIDAVEFEMSALRNLRGESVTHPPQKYYKIMPPNGWSGFGLSLYKAAIESAASYRAGGETDLHKALKKYVAENPSVVGLPIRAGQGEQEKALPSGDSIDVFFSHESIRTAVEAKSRISPREDIVRGLFQCVKYHAVLRACIAVENSDDSAEAVLVLESAFPEDLTPLRNVLDVKVVDMVRVPESENEKGTS